MFGLGLTFPPSPAVLGGARGASSANTNAGIRMDSTIVTMDMADLRIDRTSITIDTSRVTLDMTNLTMDYAR